LPIADFESKPIGNWQSEIGNEKPRAKQRGTSEGLPVFRVRRFGLPELFSRLFYVAASRLNSPRFPVNAYTPQ
jgi:hypothetical protein